jgi:hypothetical protein
MAAENSKNGMILTSTPIQQLSGPISLFYLKPTPTTYQIHTSESFQFPLILLLGDSHQDESNRCQLCDSPTCYPIESVELLQQIDKLAEEHPIDFYTESDPAKIYTYPSENQSYQNVLFKRFLRNTVLPCHDTALRSTNKYYNKCPTKYIRWHYTDIRNFSSSIEGYMYAPLVHILEKTLSESDQKQDIIYRSLFYIRLKSLLVRESIKNKELFESAKPFTINLLTRLSQLHDSPARDPLRDTVLQHLFDFFIKLEKNIPPLTNPIKKSKIYDDISSYTPRSEWIDPVYRLTWKLFTHTSRYKPKAFKKIDELTAYVKEIAEVVITLFTWIYDQILYYLDFIAKSDVSLKRAIWKQQMKQIIPSLQSSNEWANMLSLDLFSNLYYLQKFFQLYYYQSYYPVSSVYTILESMLQWNTPKLKSETDQTILPNDSSLSLPPFSSPSHTICYLLFHCIIYMEKGIVDMYTILRMIKKQGKGTYKEEGVSPSLAIAFFGNAHIHNIRNLLLSVFHYQDVVTVHEQHMNNHENRCISIPYLPLARDLEQHERTSENRNRYLRRIKEENTRRGVRPIPILPPPTLNNNNNSFYGNGGHRKNRKKTQKRFKKHI